MEISQITGTTIHEEPEDIETEKFVDLTSAKEMLTRLDQQTRVEGRPISYDSSRSAAIELLNKLPDILSRLGIKKASVSLVEHNGRIAFGGDRIPLLIEAPSQKIVAKILEPDIEAELQIGSQMAFQDGLAPRIIEATDSYIVEEYIDHETSPSLHEIAITRGLSPAIKMSVPAFLELDKRGYTLADPVHWLDELRLRNGSDSIVLIDWGRVEKNPVVEPKMTPSTARDNAIAILSGNWNLLTENIKGWLSNVELSDDRPIEAAFSVMSDTFLMCRTYHPEIFKHIGEKYEELKVSPVKLTEIMLANRYVLTGMATFLENNRLSKDKWRDVWPYFSEFVDEFVTKYNEPNSPIGVAS